MMIDRLSCFLTTLVSLLFFSSMLFGQNASIHIIQKRDGVSIRGLSVVDDSVAWVSGSNGWVARSADRGKNWRWEQIPGYEKTDFRSIYAFSEKRALVMSAGSPLVILVTTNGGHDWKQAYTDKRPEIFMDGLDFWNDLEGIAFGDPIDGHLQVLRTRDAGNSWDDLSFGTLGLTGPGEAGFAASGTGIRALPNGKVYIGTGGNRAQVLYSLNYGQQWKALPCPMLQGLPSTGIFSIAFADSLNGVAVGGDYQRDMLSDSVVWLTNDGGNSWQEPAVGTNGYRSGVEYIGRQLLIACGTSGVDLSADGGRNWEKVSGESFHVLRKSRSGTWILLAGDAGRIGELTSPLFKVLHAVPDHGIKRQTEQYP